MKRQLVTQKLWKSLQPLLPMPPRRRSKGRPRLDDGSALNGILFALTTGIPW
ncbi:transposase [Chromobacterium sphagni]|uniref:transposase n=1 Tax=Chromobacterium sphagni TaxID=1903179 RepID=UPI0009F58CFC